MKGLKFLVLGLFGMFFALNVNALDVDSQSSLANCLTTNGNTCVLSENVPFSAQIIIPNGVEVVLDLNGKSIYPEQNLSLNGGMIVVSNGAKLTVNDTIGTGAIETKDTTVYGALQVGEKNSYDSSLKATLIVNGGIMEGYYSGIVGNGSLGNTEIVVNDGIIRCTNIESSCTAIYHPQTTVVVDNERVMSTLTINGGTVTGGTGIGIRGGKLVVNGGTIIGQYEETVVIPSTSGTTTFGVGIGISQHTTKSEIQVEINGGTIKGSTALYESNPQKNSAEDIEKVTISIKGGKFEKTNLGTVAVYSENVEGFVTGGTYNVDLEETYLAEGYVTKENEDSNYVAGIEYTITVGTIENGEVVVDKTKAFAGEEVEVTATANENYELKELFVKDTSNNDIVVIDGKFVMPEGNVTITATFEKAEYEITIGTIENGEVEVDNTTIAWGEEVEVTVTPNEGYILKELIVKDASDNDVTVTDGKFVMPEGNVTITATFEKITTEVEIPVLDPEEEVEEVTVGIKDDDNKVEEILLDSIKEDSELSEKIKDTSVNVVIDILDVDADRLDEEVKGAFEEKAGEATIAEYFDISIIVKNAKDDTEIDRITDLTEEIEVMILLPEELKNTDDKVEREYFVIREHDNTVEKLNAELSEDGKYLVFKSKKFSTYALAYLDTAKVENPSTGDNIMLYVILGLVSVIGLTVVIKKRSFN